ncbi:MAG: hypothetical protein ACLGIA_04720 [Actinomycetes bacterium]
MHTRHLQRGCGHHLARVRTPGARATRPRFRLAGATLDLLQEDERAIREHVVTVVVPFEEGPRR